MARNLDIGQLWAFLQNKFLENRYYAKLKFCAMLHNIDNYRNLLCKPYRQ